MRLPSALSVLSSRRRPAALFIAAALVAAACGSDATVVAGDDPDAGVTPTEPAAEPTAEPPTEPGDDPTLAEPTPAGTVDEAALAALEAARATWAAAGLTDYSYVYTRACECDDTEWGPNTVTVRDGEVVEVVDSLRQPVVATALTVEEMFDQSEESIRAGHQSANTYDPDLGRPTRVSLDVEAQPVDGGFNLTVESFVPTGRLRADLDAARARWEANRPVNYEITYRVVCFCPEMVATATVEGSEIVDFETDADFDVEQLTVEDLFDVIEIALDHDVARIEVSFHPELGYPVDHFIDEELMMADEEHGVTVESLEAR